MREREAAEKEKERENAKITMREKAKRDRVGLNGEERKINHPKKFERRRSRNSF